MVIDKNREYIVKERGMTRLILTIDLNPLLDRRYFIHDFEVGKSYTTHDIQYIPSGNGLDIAKIVKSFNESVKATGFLGGRNVEYIIEKLDNMNIDHKFIPIEDETTASTKILSDYGVQTEIYETSPCISADEVLEFYKSYKSMIKDAKIICCSGTLPRGLPEDIYRDLIIMAREGNKRFFLDTSGKALRHGIKASPYLIKLNRDELEEYMGFIMTNEKDIIKFANYIIENGVEMVIVSLGKSGAIVVYKGYSYKINVPSVKEINSNGAGSAMMAGLAVSMIRDYDFEYMLKIAAACGTANVMEKNSGEIDMANMKSIMNEIEIEKRLIW